MLLLIRVVILGLGDLIFTLEHYLVMLIVVVVVEEVARCLLNHGEAPLDESGEGGVDRLRHDVDVFFYSLFIQMNDPVHQLRRE